MDPVLLREKKVRTRKVHRCFTCEKWFPIGSDMKVSVIVGDGRIYTLYICLKCEAFIDEYPEYVMCPIELILHEGCVLEAQFEFAEELGLTRSWECKHWDGKGYCFHYDQPMLPTECQHECEIAIHTAKGV